MDSARTRRLIWSAPRQDWLRESEPSSAALVDRLLNMATIGLPGMQLPDGTVCFTRRFSADGDVAPPEGRSLRYTAISLLGARHLDKDMQIHALAGRTAAQGCDNLVAQLSTTASVGDAALVVWAAAALKHEGLEPALARLDALDAGAGPRYVVELAWILAALVAARSAVDVEGRIERTRSRLLDSLVGTRQLFGHVTGPGLVPRYRSHVGCFADQVYPIQALARLHASVGDAEALAVANRCAEQICALQGGAGQWWWHYDSRTGEVVEGYPVYSVHQHAMAPMALLDLAEAGGRSESAAIRRGLAWMVDAPEVSEPLMLDGPGLTVRKAARNDPRKLVRGVRAATTSVRPGLRLSALDRLYPPIEVDRECRPYEFGWMLDCWLGGVDTIGRTEPPVADAERR